MTDSLTFGPSSQAQLSGPPLWVTYHHIKNIKGLKTDNYN